MGRVQPRSLGNRGGTWYFLASSFPLIAPESVRHGTFLPLIAPESVCFRGLPLLTCGGIGKIGHRIATGMVHCLPLCHLELPLPLSRNRYATEPIESTESAVAV